MIHVKHTPIASGAVVASLWLEHIAHQAVPTTFILVVTEMEAPEHRHLSRICSHRLEEAPNEHQKQEIIHNQEGNILLIL
jgi:hypothetical protein